VSTEVCNYLRCCVCW